MKTSIGLFFLVILLATTSGCTTQQAQPSVTETTLTVTVTEVPATVNTPLPATATTTVSTTTAPVITTVATTAAIPKPTITASTKITTIHIRNNTFVPAELTVLPGTGITWINDDAATHRVKATGNATGKFTSAEIVSGARFGYTFGEATGTYEFMDPGYPDMKGAIIVKVGETPWIPTSTPSTPGLK